MKDLKVKIRKVFCRGGKEEKEERGPATQVPKAKREKEKENSLSLLKFSCLEYYTTASLNTCAHPCLPCARFLFFSFFDDAFGIRDTFRFQFVLYNCRYSLSGGSSPCQLQPVNFHSSLMNDPSSIYPGKFVGFFVKILIRIARTFLFFIFIFLHYTKIENCFRNKELLMRFFL